jgi:hypothetical protein
MAAGKMTKEMASGFIGFLMASSYKALLRIVNGMVFIYLKLKLQEIKYIQNIKMIKEKDYKHNIN